MYYNNKKYKNIYNTHNKTRSRNDILYHHIIIQSNHDYSIIDISDGCILFPATPACAGMVAGGIRTGYVRCRIYNGEVPTKCWSQAGLGLYIYIYYQIYHSILWRFDWVQNRKNISAHTRTCSVYICVHVRLVDSLLDLAPLLSSVSTGMAMIAWSNSNQLSRFNCRTDNWPGLVDHSASIALTKHYI